MFTIWKYELKPNATIEIPEDSKVLSVAMQHGVPMIWVLVDNTKPIKSRKFMTFGTGHTIKEDIKNLKFIGTFFPDNLVFHLFEVVE